MKAWLGCFAPTLCMGHSGGEGADPAPVVCVDQVGRGTRIIKVLTWETSEVASCLSHAGNIRALFFS